MKKWLTYVSLGLILFFGVFAAFTLSGMERSYDEILKVLDLMDRADLKPLVYRGSRQYLPGPLTPVPSEAAGRISESSGNMMRSAD